MRIEGATHAGHHRQVMLIEHHGHVLELLGADAVFTGDAAAGRHADTQDLASGGQYPLCFFWVATVVADVGMQVAVAGMEHVGEGQLIAGGDGGDLLQCVDELGAGHHSIQHVEVGP